MIRKWLIWLALLAFAFSVSACTASIPETPFPATEAYAPATEYPTKTPVPITEPPTSTSSGNCYYVWAYQQLPDLSTQIQDSMREIQPAAEASARAYGENCVYEDGHANFSAMETDFSMTLQVGDVNNADELGGWIRQAMTVIERFPSEQLAGP